MSNNFKKIMYDLAVSIAKTAAEGGTPFPDRLDAFKALNAYYATLAKQRGKADDDSEGDDPGGVSLADLTLHLRAESASGATPAVVRGHRRHS